jgi:lipid-binding SYLF domain-containing protein
MTRHKLFLTAATVLLGGLLFHVTADASLLSKGASPDEQRAEIRKMRDKTLADLYRTQPDARGHVEKAAGYAVFSNFGVKILVAGGGSGTGIAIDNKSRKETFMRMAEVQAGLGFGVKKFRLVWVFEKKSDLDRFVNSGWELGAQTTASAKVSGQGTNVLTGALSVSPGVWLYQLTDDGLALELTAKGTKYYKDADLN